MKHKIISLCVCSVLLSSTQAQATGWLGNAAALAGDWLTSWGRDYQTPQSVKVPEIKKTGNTGADCLRVQKEKADQNIKDRAALDASMILPSAKGIGEMPCFDKYKNASLSGMLGVPSFSGLLDQLKGQACSYIDQQVQQAIAPINQSVWLPGGVRVNTGAVFSNTGAGPTANAGVQSTGQFSLPQIFK